MRRMQLQGNTGYQGAVDSARTSLDAARQGQYIPTQAMTVMGGIGSQTPQSASPASAVAQDRYGLGTDATMADAFQARSVQRDQAKRNQFASLGARQQMVTRNAQNRAGRRRGQAALPQLTRPQAEYLATISSGGEPTMAQGFAAGGKEPAMATQEYTQANLMNSLLSSEGGPALITQAMANPDTPLGKLITAWMSGGGKMQGKVTEKAKPEPSYADRQFPWTKQAAGGIANWFNKGQFPWTMQAMDWFKKSKPMWGGSAGPSMRPPDSAVSVR